METAIPESEEDSSAASFELPFGIDVRVSTITASFQLTQPVNLQILAQSLPCGNVVYDPYSRAYQTARGKPKKSFKNQASIELRFRGHKVSVCLFCNGQVKLAGCKSEDECHELAALLVTNVRRCVVVKNGIAEAAVRNPAQLRSVNLRVLMRKVDGSLPFRVPLKAAYEHLLRLFTEVKYDPSTYNAIRLVVPVRPKLSASVLIFESGKVACMGQISMDNITVALDRVASALQGYLFPSCESFDLAVENTINSLDLHQLGLLESELQQLVSGELLNLLDTNLQFKDSVPAPHAVLARMSATALEDGNRQLLPPAMDRQQLLPAVVPALEAQSYCPINVAAQAGDSRDRRLEVGQDIFVFDHNSSVASGADANARYRYQGDEAIAEGWVNDQANQDPLGIQPAQDIDAQDIQLDEPLQDEPLQGIQAQDIDAQGIQEDEPLQDIQVDEPLQDIQVDEPLQDEPLQGIRAQDIQVDEPLQDIPAAQVSQLPNQIVSHFAIQLIVCVLLATSVLNSVHPDSDRNSTFEKSARDSCKSPTSSADAQHCSVVAAA